MLPILLSPPSSAAKNAWSWYTIESGLLCVQSLASGFLFGSSKLLPFGRPWAAAPERRARACHWRTTRMPRSSALALRSRRLRLTPPRPHARGSAWHHLRRPVARGFEATFTFQLAAPTRRCAVHRDLDFSLALYERCAVRGGDGLAFVVADDPNGTAALGAAGGGLGYAGLRRALVVELDADYSPPADGFAADHVELRSAGAGAVDAAAPAHRLAPPAAWDLADGREHLVRVAYAPSVPARYAGNLSAYPAAARYAVDGGEARRLGLVTVFLDDGVAADRPALAVPLNLPEALGLPGDGTAHVGLTAATGERWQAHDVTSWAVCDRPGRDAVP